jgi:hypothetical protein
MSAEPMSKRTLIHAGNYRTAALVARSLGVRKFVYVSSAEQLMGHRGGTLYVGHGERWSIWEQALARGMKVEEVAT